jgi:DNA-binding GntR family transcriptional regulator
MAPSQDTATRIAESVVELIIDGVLRPRERLIETELARRFLASRPPVREALRLLESEGLVIKDGRRGFSVTELSRHELRDMYEVFFVVEELYTRLAAPRMTSPVLDQLREIVAQMELAVRKNDASAYFSANLDFHSAILEASGNVFLRRFYRMLRRQTLRYRRIPLALTERRRQSLQEHRGILQALRARDGALAGKRAREHAQNAYRLLDRQLSLLSPAGAPPPDAAIRLLKRRPPE